MYMLYVYVCIYIYIFISVLLSRLWILSPGRQLFGKDPRQDLHGAGGGLQRRLHESRGPRGTARGFCGMGGQKPKDREGCLRGRDIFP